MQVTVLKFTLCREFFSYLISVYAGLVPGKPLLSQSTDNMTKMRNIKDKGNAEYIASESASNGGMSRILSMIEFYDNYQYLRHVTSN